MGEQKRWIANALIAIGIGYFYIVTSQCYLFYTALVKPGFNRNQLKVY